MSLECFGRSISVWLSGIEDKRQDGQERQGGENRIWIFFLALLAILARSHLRLFGIEESEATRY
jgi:hypothetical protein